MDQQTKIRFDEFDKERGLYETDIYENGMWKLRWDNCGKNPGHCNFIPRKDFSIEHLPLHARHDEFLEYFKCLADLTCQIVVSYISLYRPDKFPYAAFRGKNMSTVGTGMINPHYYKLHKDSACPCTACSTSLEPYLVWTEFRFCTSAHVVCHDEEAKSSRVLLFYDALKDPRMRCLEVLKVLWHDEEQDLCWLSCCTHDVEVSSKIESMGKCFKELQENAWNTYLKMVQRQEWVGNVCVIPSHPHGSYKHLSVGQVTCTQTAKEEDDMLYECLVYKTPTCPGSSGAPVVCIGEAERMLVESNGNEVPTDRGEEGDGNSWSLFYFCPSHSGATKTFGNNKSGGWPYIKA